MKWLQQYNKLSRNLELKPASTYMFGPLIDAPPFHPDINNQSYMQQSLVDIKIEKSSSSRRHAIVYGNQTSMLVLT